jgi:cytochrome bd-type quinol oxidase subunit 1
MDLEAMWLVYELLRINEALSKFVRAEQILFSLILFTRVYALLQQFSIWKNHL